MTVAITRHGEVAQHLPVIGQVKVIQAVLVLPGRVLGHERLISTVLLQAVQQAASVGQPEGHHLKVVDVFLQSNGLANEIHKRSGWDTASTEYRAQGQREALP